MQKLHSVSTFVRNNSYVWEKALSLARALGLSTLSPDETGTHLSARTASSVLGEIPQQPLHHFSKVFYSCDCTRNSLLHYYFVNVYPTSLFSTPYPINNLYKNSISVFMENFEFSDD